MGNAVHALRTPTKQSSESSSISTSTKVKYYMAWGKWSDIQTGDKLPDLPMEIVLIIIDFAGYWNVASIGKVEQINGQNLNHLYFVMHTKQFLGHPYYADQLVPLKKLVIEVHSHDQGWSSYANDQNTYRGSWTFGEIAVLDGKHTEVKGESRMRLYTNLHAKEDWQIHRKVFNFLNAEQLLTKYSQLTEDETKQDIQRREEQLEQEYPQDGVKYWVASPEECIRVKRYLQQGYNLGFMLISMFPGWCNFTKEIKVVAMF